MAPDPDVTTEPRTQDATATAAAEEIPPHRYTAALAQVIEARWQDYWDDHGTFEAPNPSGPLADPEKLASRDRKLFVLDMFPYPSGAGLHVGHLSLIHI